MENVDATPPVDPARSKLPETRKEFWRDKIAANIDRDERNIAELKKGGWRIAIVWECSLKNQKEMLATIESLKSWIISSSEWFESA